MPSTRQERPRRKPGRRHDHHPLRADRHGKELAKRFVGLWTGEVDFADTREFITDDIIGAQRRARRPLRIGEELPLSGNGKVDRRKLATVVEGRSGLPGTA
ncbi:hypothetical protein ABZ499_17380 [Streptomyces sp. NPDC019990]|uniref:hypothetical protein n=1 Tax=Streptomyces sp. NPDC019990 TaxID=3154693 RepID=UPI0033C0CFCC